MSVKMPLRSGLRAKAGPKRPLENLLAFFVLAGLYITSSLSLSMV